MKTTLKICANELRTMFYSPIAWFVLIIFLIQCGMTYFGAIDDPVTTQEIGGSGLRDMKNSLTDEIYVFIGAVFRQIMENLYLYIPLLTMGLISRETGSGTIKLLFSSPVTVRQIVLGKYLAIMIYALLMLGIIGIFLVAGFFNIVHADVGMLWGAALGLYLLICAYAAIGLFMSCLTTYQIVAAISTFVAIGFLSLIGRVWQDVDFVRQATYFLSIGGRAESMLLGLISTKDVLYFLVIIGVFLSFSIYRLRSAMESKPALVRAGRYAGAAAVGIAVGCLCSLPALTAYVDLTRDQKRTLTPTVQSLIVGMKDQPLEINTYTNLLDWRTFWLGMPTERKRLEALWNSYLRFNPNIKLNYEYYYDRPLTDLNFGQDETHRGKTLAEIAAITFKSHRVRMPNLKTPEEMRQIINLEPELNRFVMHLKYGGQSTFLRIFDDQLIWPTETEIAAALKRLLQSQMPKLAFATGRRERDITRMGDRDYKVLTNLSTYRYSLTNQGFDVQTVALDTEEIPAGITALVLADPTTELSAAAMARVERYIDEGGNLFIAGEPSRISVLNPLLQRLGVRLAEGMLVYPSKDQHESLVSTSITPAAAGFTRLLSTILKQDSQPVTLPGAAPIIDLQTGIFDVQPLLVTHAKDSWLEKEPLTDAAPATFSEAAGDERKDFTVMVGLTRRVKDREQRIVVSGDADFMSNVELSRINIETYNFLLSTALFSWLDEGKFPIDTVRPPAKDKRMTLGTEAMELQKTLLVWVLPGLVLAFGAILLIRRRRK